MVTPPRRFDFDVVYKNGSFKTQPGALSRLCTTGETQATLDEDEIFCFTVDGQGLEDPEWPENWTLQGAMDAVFASGDTEKPLPGNFVPFTTEKMIREQFGDPFCTKLRAPLNGGEDLPVVHGPPSDCLQARF